MPDYTWNITTSGTHDWNNSSNWLPNTGYPNAINDTANFSLGVDNQEINISSDIVIKNLIITTTIGNGALKISSLSGFKLSILDYIDVSSDVNIVNELSVQLDGSLNIIGNGTLQLSGNNSISGIINSAHLNLYGTNNNLLTITNTGTVNYNNNVVVDNLVSFVNNGILNIIRSVNLTINYIISGSGDLIIVVTLSSSITLTNTNTYTGSTTINSTNNSSGLILQGDNVLQNTSIMNLNSGRLSFYPSINYLVFDRNIVVNGSYIYVAINKTVDLTGTISGNNFFCYGNGDLIITGTISYSGNTRLIIGGFQLGNGFTSPTIITPLQILFLSIDGGKLCFNPVESNYMFNGSITNNASSISFPVLSVASGKVVTINSSVNGSASGKLYIYSTIGSGTLVFSNSNNTLRSINIDSNTNLKITGGFNSMTSILNSGNLYIEDGASFNNMTSSRTITNNGTIYINRTTPLTFNCIIASTGNLVINGTSNIILASVNTFNGNTTINNGILTVNGSVSSPITVNSNGTLKGNGTSNANVIVNGTFSPGNSIGTYTINGDLTLTNGSVTIFELDVNATNVRGINFTAIDVTNTGNLNIMSGASLLMKFINPNVNFLNSFWNNVTNEWNFIQAFGGTGNINIINYEYSPNISAVNGPINGIVTTLRTIDSDLNIIYTSGGSFIPCFAYKNIIKYQLPDDIMISRQGNYNNKWIDINGLLLTSDHLINDGENIIHASEYSNNICYVNDELVDLISSDGRFIKINGINVATCICK